MTFHEAHEVVHRYHHTGARGEDHRAAHLREERSGTTDQVRREQVAGKSMVLPKILVGDREIIGTDPGNDVANARCAARIKLPPSPFWVASASPVRPTTVPPMRMMTVPTAKDR
jgi:hypothetical protein